MLRQNYKVKLPNFEICVKLQKEHCAETFQQNFLQQKLFQLAEI